MQRTPRPGADLNIHVPLGTVVKDAVTNAVLADLAADGARVVVAGGGRGGGPLATAGARRAVRLELKTLADVGLVRPMPAVPYPYCNPNPRMRLTAAF